MNENVQQTEDEIWQAEVRRAREEDQKEQNARRSFDPRAWKRQCVRRCALIFVFCLSLPIVWSDIDNNLLPFDSAAWKAARTSRNSSQQQKYISRLLHQKDLVGMTPTQILNLLGDPDNVSTDAWYYKCEGYSSYVTLDIDFENNRVVQCEKRELRS